MRALLTEQAAYNSWANNLVINTMKSVEPHLIEKMVNSSFQSLRDTVIHCWSAEDIWLQRLNNVEDTIWAQSIFKGSFDDACNNWLLSSTGLEKFLENSNDALLTTECRYKDLKGNQYTTPVYQVLHHVFNHATYHRGQLITLLRQVGVTTLPRTDFIVFVRER